MDSLFNKVNCDRSAIDDMLGSKEGVTDKNMLQYLGIIEERTNQLLYIQAYILSQKVQINNICIYAFQFLVNLLILSFISI